jgi:sodium/proline symporter
MLVSFIIYSICIVLLGIFLGRAKEGDSETFFLGNRSLGPWVTALSAGASSESAWALMGLSGTAYLLGVQALWLIPGAIAGYLFNFLVMAPRIRTYSVHINAITIPDVLSKTFNNSRSIRWIASVIIFLTMTTYVIAQLTASGKAFIAIFNMHYWHGVLIGLVIIMMYVYTGGFKSSAITDLVQGLFMLFAMILIPVIAVNQAGGFSEMVHALERIDPQLTMFDGGEKGFKFFAIVAGWAGIGLAYPGLPHQLVRFMSIRDRNELKKSAVISTLWVTLVFSGAIFLGLSGRILYDHMADSEQLLPVFASQELPGIASGFILAAIVAAISSTADSQLLAATSSLSHDILQHIFNIRIRNIHRYILAAIGIIACIFALFEVRVIFDFVLYAWAGLGASFGPPLIFTLFWRKTRKWGVVAGMLGGFITTILWKETGLGSSVVYEIVPAILVSSAFTFLFSICSGKTS